MPSKYDWLFDAIWELSDKSVDAGFDRVAEKLEEAMDIFLVERRAEQGQAVFRSRRARGPLPPERQIAGPANQAAHPADIFPHARPGTHARLRRFMAARGAG